MQLLCSLCYDDVMKSRLEYMKADTIEPGLLRLFRTYVLVVNVFFLFNIVMMAGNHDVFSKPLFYINLIVLLLLDFLLFYPRFQKLLGKKFLATGIIFFLFMNALQYWTILQIELPVDMFEWVRTYFSSSFVVLFIPMMITAWQYGLPGTIVFLLISATLEASIFLFYADATQGLYSLGLIFFRSVNFLLIGGIISRLMSAQRKQRYDLKAANQQLSHYASTLEQLSTSRERNRLARELHDTLAHTLSGVSVQLEAVRALWENSPEDAHSMLGQALSDTRSGLTETRRALKDLRAEPLEDLGLLLALNHLCTDLETKTGVVIDMQLPEQFDSTSAVLQHCIYRTVQEAFNNIDHHAGAKKVLLHLEVEELEECSEIHLTIQDDGIGFDPVKDVESEHFGLRGIRERVNLLDGTFSLIASPGKGAQLLITLKEERE